MPRPIPSPLARLTGLVYLVIIIAGLFAEGFVRGTLVVPGDAAATAAAVLGAQELFRLGAAADIVMLVADGVIAILFYRLFRPVNATLSAMAAAFQLLMNAILGFNLLLHLAPLILLHGDGPLAGFTAGQTESLALLALEMHAETYRIALVFFGIHCLLLGWLIWHSRFLPRALGALILIAGLGYIADMLASLLAPDLAAAISPFAIAPAVVGEFALCGWLLLRGVNHAGWAAWQRS